MAGGNKHKKKQKKLTSRFKSKRPILADYSNDETVPPSDSQDLSNEDVARGWRRISKENAVNDVTAAESSHGRTFTPLPSDLMNKRIRADNQQAPAANTGLQSSSHQYTSDERRQNFRKSNANEMIGENGTRQLQNFRTLPTTLTENNQTGNSFQLDIEANDFNSGSSVPVRGLYKGGNIDKLTNHRKNKLIVYIHPGKYFRPVGENERCLASWLGYCARSVGRPSDTWDQHLPKHRSRLWNMVKDIFEVSPESPEKWKILEESGKVNPDTPESKFESYCFSMMRVYFRKWKERLHDKYKMYSSDEGRLKHVPGGLSTNDWKDLLKWFGSEEFKAWSAINSENRKAQKVIASSGPTPFAQVEYDLMDEETGELPNASDVWMATHSIMDEEGENPQFRDSESRELYEEMKRIEDEPRNETESGPTSVEILQQVFGVRSGYVRGKGLGYKGSTKGMGCSSSSSNNNDEVKELKNELAILKVKLQAQEEKEQEFASYFKVMDAIIKQCSPGTDTLSFLRSTLNHSEE